MASGCVMQPTEEVHARPAAPAMNEIRVGFELIVHGPQRDESADAAGGQRQDPGSPPRADAARYPRQAPPSEERPSLRPLTRRQISALPSASERFTFRMLHSLVGQEGESLPREFGWSYLLRRMAAVDGLARDPWSADQDQDVADQAAFQEIAPQMVGKSIRRALREIPLVRTVELWFEDFKTESLPLSGTVLDGRDEERRELGHLSLRVRDGNDPLQVTYSVRGWRVGASQDTVRAGFSAPLGDDLSFAVVSTLNHVQNTYDARAEVKFTVDARTRLFLIFGNQVHLFPGPTLERYQNSEFEGGAGAMAYVETIF